MEIYIVSHYYDNGESYEDFREYEDLLYYSSFKNASKVFWEKVTSDYHGIIKLKEVTLDTQEITILEESAWIACTSSWEYCCDEYYFDCEEYYHEFGETIEEAWEIKKLEDMQEADEEWEIIDEWLNHKGENYEIFEEINASRLEYWLKQLEILTSKNC